MFDQPRIDKFPFEGIPVNRGIFLMDEIWMADYDRYLSRMLDGHSDESVGYVSYVAARSISPAAIQLSWYPNIHTRFHEVSISLPRDQFVACVDCYAYDEKPRLFVKSAWLTNLHLRAYSVFVLVDAIGIKASLEGGSITREKLLTLRDRIDALATKYSNVSFISFADSLLLKSNWTVGQYDSQVQYTYEPEIFLRAIEEIDAVYREVLGLGVYAVLAQGSNIYYDDPLLHISAAGNHISLNSLGLPFAQLMSIDSAARKAIRENAHPPAELYMDEHFFDSLRFAFEFKKDLCPKSAYRGPLMSEDGHYYLANRTDILKNRRDAEVPISG